MHTLRPACPLNFNLLRPTTYETFSLGHLNVANQTVHFFTQTTIPMVFPILKRIKVTLFYQLLRQNNLNYLHNFKKIFHTSPPVHPQTLLAFPSKYIQHQITSHLLHHNIKFSPELFQ